MRVPTVGWAFFGLAVLILAGYVLNRGLFIWGTINPEPMVVSGTQYVTKYAKHCRYLHFAGINDRSISRNDTEEQAARYVCQMFDD